MPYSDQRNTSCTASPPRKRQIPPAEQTDEAAGQVEKGQVDVEREIPTEHTESVERIEPQDRPDPPLFEA
jgi:hypothetical protein